jgi:ferritin-like metal-binding protein YciE
MSTKTQKVVQYLNEAHASEVGLTRVLQSQIAMTPRGRYRTGLEKHLEETRSHAERVEQRLGELEQGNNPLQVGVGIAESLLAQTIALWKTPLDLMRGSSGEEKVFKNAKDAAATEALEIATYTGLERLARTVGDETTATLAASIRADEERMLDRVLREIPKLADAVVQAEIKGNGSYDISKTGAADTLREMADAVKETAREGSEEVRKTARSAQKASATATKRTARKGNTQARKTARQARKVPGVARVEGEVKGAVAGEKDLPIAGYDGLTADEIVAKLSSLSQIDLAKVDAYERKNEDRSTIRSRINTLQADEPWPGYDELNAADVRTVLADADEDRAKAVREYERAHKNRAAVLTATERELAKS